MASLCFSPIKARVIRLTRLDGCGNPVVGPRSVLVSEGFTQVVATAQTEEGEEFLVKNAWGDLCVNDKDLNRLKRFDLSMDFCEIDPEGIELMTGSTLITAAGPSPVSGTSIGNFFGEDVVSDQSFSLELWQRLAGGACTEGAGATQWAYWCFARITPASIGDLTFENGPLTVSLSGATLGAGTDFGAGPFDVLPQSFSTTQHAAFAVTETQPPTAACGLQSLA